MALYSGKQYDDAITYALKAYELQKKTIDSNINYMTSSERESFLSSKGGMGNKMLKFCCQYNQIGYLLSFIILFLLKKDIC